MKATLIYIKENWVLVIIKLLLVSIFIVFLTIGILKIIEHYKFAFGESETKLADYFYITTTFSYLKPAVVLLIPILGIFIKRKTGWILIQSYFYFWISNLIFMSTQEGSPKNDFILFSVLAFLLTVFIIKLMNNKKISNLTYGIEKTELIYMNILASAIGMLLTIIINLLKANDF